MKQIVDQALGVKIGAPTTFKNMTVFPLIGGQGTAADYLTLDEALAQKLAAITEVSEGGSVPELKFVNSGDKRVFLLDGEAGVRPGTFSFVRMWPADVPWRAS
jgi:hypothetical protein